MVRGPTIGRVLPTQPAGWHIMRKCWRTQCRCRCADASTSAFCSSCAQFVKTVLEITREGCIEHKDLIGHWMSNCQLVGMQEQLRAGFPDVTNKDITPLPVMYQCKSSQARCVKTFRIEDVIQPTNESNCSHKYICTVDCTVIA